eukprot:COSAG02_NODE_8122_length_2699_cov_7.290769_1_plen_171_part_00
MTCVAIIKVAGAAAVAVVGAAAAAAAAGVAAVAAAAVAGAVVVVGCTTLQWTLLARCSGVFVGAFAFTFYATSVRSAIDCIARIRLARSAGVSVVAIASALYASAVRSAIDCIAWVLAITIYSKIPLLALAHVFYACTMLATFVAVRANTFDTQAEDEWFSRVIVRIEYA